MQQALSHEFISCGGRGDYHKGQKKSITKIIKHMENYP